MQPLLIKSLHCRFNIDVSGGSPEGFAALSAKPTLWREPLMSENIVIKKTEAFWSVSAGGRSIEGTPCHIGNAIFQYVLHSTLEALAKPIHFSGVTIVSPSGVRFLVVSPLTPWLCVVILNLSGLGWAIEGANIIISTVDGMVAHPQIILAPYAIETELDPVPRKTYLNSVVLDFMPRPYRLLTPYMLGQEWKILAQPADLVIFPEFNAGGSTRRKMWHPKDTLVQKLIHVASGAVSGQSIACLFNNVRFARSFTISGGAPDAFLDAFIELS